ncbi:hypothetical protein [Chryseobacterium tongliaoense]|uniref:hypothetical protein n=1 Tax=Chryseobacterium tongliaoense TaxID=3240933 RepID=UPI00351457E0
MKQTPKIILFAIIIFVVSAIAVTTWYIAEIGAYEDNIGFISVKNVLFRFGVVGAVPCTLLLTAGYISFLKIKKPWLLGAIIVILGFLLYLSSLWFLWYMSIRSLVKDPFAG